MKYLGQFLEVHPLSIPSRSLRTAGLIRFIEFRALYLSSRIHCSLGDQSHCSLKCPFPYFYVCKGNNVSWVLLWLNKNCLWINVVLFIKKALLMVKLLTWVFMWLSHTYGLDVHIFGGWGYLWAPSSSDLGFWICKIKWLLYGYCICTVIVFSSSDFANIPYIDTCISLFLYLLAQKWG